MSLLQLMRRTLRWPLPWLTGLALYRFPILAYAASRAVVAFAVVLAATITSGAQPHAPFVSVLAGWDGDWYREIAQHGYPHTISEIAGRAQQTPLAFFPIYPALVWFVRTVGDLRISTALLGVPLLAGLLATCLLWGITKRHFGSERADVAAVLFCFAPGAFVLSAAYSEAVLLCFALLCLDALDNARWERAGLFGALATASRPNGIGVVAACAWAAWVAVRKRSEWRAVIAPVLAPMGLLLFVAYVGWATHEPLAYLRIQRDGWSQEFDFGAGVGHDVWAFAFGTQRDFGYVILMIGLLVAVAGILFLLRSQLPFTYAAYALVVLGLSLGSTNLSARPRFVFTAFPIVIAMAEQLPARIAWMFAVVSGAVMVTVLVWHHLAPIGAIPP